MYKQYTAPDKGVLHAGGGVEGWATAWSQGGFSSERQVRKLASQPQWREMKRFVRPGWKVLEAGCGLGSWVRFLQSKEMEATGLDFESKTLGRLRKAHPELDLVGGDVRRLPFHDSTFDALVSWGVIEHLEEGPNAALKEFFRVVRPGGYMFITVPWLNRRKLLSGMEDGGSNFDSVMSEFHQYHLTLSELSEAIHLSGFKVLHQKPSSIHFKSLLPDWFRSANPILTKILDRSLTPFFPSKVIASMQIATCIKP
ncbi:MAG: class I SAM-dependent methyltransferase [Pseudomonadales bacterium]|nr:class I SAM-dependent methyltransferase [Pseudomonadales bacterium]MBO7004804.1 class I SAM-dependent methyltransferase [Pseudomonadales bacterium]